MHQLCRISAVDLVRSEEVADLAAGVIVDDAAPGRLGRPAIGAFPSGVERARPLIRDRTDATVDGEWLADLH